MTKGSKYEFLIPPALAYGDRAVGGVIPAGSPLFFEVELLDVRPYKDPSTAGEQVSESVTPAKNKVVKPRKLSKRKK